MPPLNLPTRSETSSASPIEYEPYIPATTLRHVPLSGWVLIGLLFVCLFMSFILGQCLTWGQPTLTEKEWRRRREEELEEEMEKQKEERERREWERKDALLRAGGLREEGTPGRGDGRDGSTRDVERDASGKLWKGSGSRLSGSTLVR